ncbi:MAG TPA: pyridoxamine 5'-phosphate oxidase [Xanthomonadaceae bacterium]|nr:pyridoxamine 5'-phosphate oxidase [Xanthomonadaceae bacterium]
MTDLYAEALLTFRELLDAARVAGDPEPTAMTLATAGADGRVSARVVLLKAFDERGFVFYSNTRSRKGRQLAANAHCALCFLWKRLREGVQVRIEGAVERVSDAEADAYFGSRPRVSQLGAWASKQSATLPQRRFFDERMEQLQARYEGQPVPRPPHWTGYRVRPDLIEFWYGAQFRLHDRDLYELREGRWRKRKLYP